MAKLPFECKKHGKTLAYTATIKSGKCKGQTRRQCVDCRADDVRKRWKELKQETVAAYGGKCSCCGEVEPKFLTIDHISGDGKTHRDAGIRGYKLYEWLKARGYPKDNFRLLCFNCNCARGQYGKCPHES